MITSMIMPRLILTAVIAAALTACAGVPEWPNLGKVANTEARRAVVHAATAQIGAPYKYGGNDRTGFDAPGLVQFAYREAGYQVPRTREDQLRAGQPVDYANLRPADPVFFRLTNRRRDEETFIHVGVYIGNNRMVHSLESRDEVEAETIGNQYWQKRFITGIRVLP